MNSNASAFPSKIAGEAIVATYFDEKFYLRLVSKEDLADLSPLEHYLIKGWKNGLDPNPFFDTKWYLQNNPPVKAEDIEPLSHYATLGWKQGLDPHPAFNVRFYLESNEDVKSSGQEPLSHYLTQGLKLNRPTFPTQALTPIKASDENGSLPGTPNRKAFIEFAGAFFGKTALLAGWILPGNSPNIWLEDSRGNKESLAKAFTFQRDDVAKRFGELFGHQTKNSGFIFVWHHPQEAHDRIKIVCQTESGPFVLAEQTWEDASENPHASVRYHSYKVQAGWVKPRAHLEFAGAMFDREALISGWAVPTGASRTWLEDSQGNRESLSKAFYFNREDVMIRLGQEFGHFAQNAGFIVRWPHPQKPGNSIKIACGSKSNPTLLAEKNWEDIGTNPSASTHYDRLLAKAGLKPLKTSAPSDKPKAFIDKAGIVPGFHGMLAGWVIPQPGLEIWLQDTKGNRRTLEDAVSYHREDVVAAFVKDYGTWTADAGFVIAWPFPQEPSDTIRILTTRDGRCEVLAERVWDDVPKDPVAYARWSFELGTPHHLFGQRLEKGEGELIESLMSKRHTRDKTGEKPPKIEAYGTPPSSPRYSVVVPLYGRYDFVEHQLLKFSKDPLFRSGVELIYVIDDPTLVVPLTEQAEILFKLYQVPFKLVWGYRNRGFSGANNLGVSVASGQSLVFLNSDVFPTAPGWVEKLCAPLEDEPGIGIVGTRLLFPSGGIQHCGMNFAFSRTLGLWLNEHPFSGTDPSYDRATGLTDRPAVTGACLAIRRADYLKVGGFDEGYLIGDFEDSDLCLKIHAQNLRVAYLPSVQLTHLERQSLRSIGDPGFRSFVVLYNAWRHQKLWGQIIPQYVQNSW